MAYQTFPGESAGDSQTQNKFAALKYTNFAGLSVLDVGCNEGYFCIEAAQRGARYILGVDRDPAAIKSAARRAGELNLDISFTNIDWLDLIDDQKFDVIFFLSSLHYAEKQEDIIANLMQKLTPEGVLILECGVIESDSVEFVKVVRAIDERWFPTMGKLKAILEPYAWKLRGKSVPQVGDPIGRKVFHIRHLKPVVILCLGKSHSGKTTLARLLSQKQIPALLLDDHIQRMSRDFLERLPRIVDGENLDVLYRGLVPKDVVIDFAKDVVQAIDRLEAPVIIIEGALSSDSPAAVETTSELQRRGYFVWAAESLGSLQRSF